MSNYSWKSIPAAELRKFKDQNIQNLEHYVVLARVKDIPAGLSHKPNPRANTKLFSNNIYKEIQKSLLDPSDPTFHLKNKGIVITASEAKFEKGTENDILHLGFSEEDGILDGSHTYRLLDKNRDQVPNNQFVRIEARVGNVGDLLSDMAEGLNTTVQVQSQSMADYKKEFDWIKDVLKSEPYAEKIAWVESEDKEIPVNQLIRLMMALNPIKFPGTSSHPVIAYSGKSTCLEEYRAEYEENLKGEKTFERFKAILPEVLQLHDYFHLEAKDIYNRGNQKWEMNKNIVEKRERGAYQFPFTGENNKTKIHDGAFYPLFASFRCLIEVDKSTGLFKWKIPFAKVKKTYQTIGAQLLDMTINSCRDFQGNVQTLGKKSGHWNNLYVTVENFVLKNN